MTTDRAITIAEFAERFTISVHGALALVNAGTVKAIDVRRPGSAKPRWRISPKALEAFISARSNKQPVKASPRRHKKTDSRVIEFF